MKILSPQAAIISVERDQVNEDIVTPGQMLTQDLQYMRGHGTYIANETLIASVAGRVERINKLISVKPLKSRYSTSSGKL